MKYQELLQIAHHLEGFKRLHFIKRVAETVLCLCFDKDEFIFDMSRSKSAIYKANLTHKNFNAPFDIKLKEFFSNAIVEELKVLENNRILYIKVIAQKSYKNLRAKIYFEFTGKNTNVIIVDENEIIIEALRHIEKSFRLIRVGQKLQALTPFKMDNEFKKIDDFDEYFKATFEGLNAQKIALLKENKKAILDKKISHLKEKLQSLDEEKCLVEKANRLSEEAKLITANLYKLKDYEREFELLNFLGQKIQFKLDKAPKIWANEAFKEAKKLKQKASNLHLQKNNLLEKLDFFKKLLELIDKANSLFELEILLPKKEKKEEKKEKEGLSVAKFYYNEFTIFIGKNEKGNEYLLKNAKKDDMWFHIKNYPSSHGFIVSNKQKLSEEVVEFTAKLCVEFSNLNKGAYLVDYTQRKFVTVKQKAFVEYHHHKSVRITKE